MIPHDGLTVRKHMLTDVGHEKTCGKPEPYQHVEHRAEQSCERCEQVGNGSGPEPERCQDRRLVPRPSLTRTLSHDHRRSEPLFLSDGKTGRIYKWAPCGPARVLQFQHRQTDQWVADFPRAAPLSIRRPLVDGLAGTSGLTHSLPRMNLST